MFKKPFYEVEIKTTGCTIELSVNDCYSFSNNQPGGLGVDWPINEFILESGIQYIKFKVLPFDTKPIIKLANIQLNIYEREVNGDIIPRVLVHSYNSESIFSDKELYYYENEFAFTATVPYKMNGWKTSVNLRKESDEYLFQELFKWNKKLFQIFKTMDSKEYLNITQERYQDIVISNYFTEQEKHQTIQSVFAGVSSEINFMPANYYKLCFYGDGKLVGLKSLKYPPGFFYEAIDRHKGNDFYESMLFHKKNSKSDLSIIR